MLNIPSTTPHHTVRMESHGLEKGMNVEVFTTRKRTVYIAVIVVVLLLALVALAFFFLPQISSESNNCQLKGDELKLPPKPEQDPSPVGVRAIPFTGRLPETLVPEHYVIWMKIYMDTSDDIKSNSYDGKINITVKCMKNTNIVKLHTWLLNIDFDSISIYRLPNLDNLWIGNVGTNDTNNFLEITTRKSLIAGDRYMISITYYGQLRIADPLGFYLTSYNHQGQIRWVALTRFEPTFARKAFPCFDEPQLKATFDIVITHRLNRTALSNMPVVRTVTDGDWRTTYFNTSVPMSTYLVSFAILDFNHIERVTSSGVQFRVWVRPDKIAEATYALDIGVKILSFFENYFQISYPIPKMDMIGTPVYPPMGLENWGLIMYQESRLLYNPAVHSPDRQFEVASIVAHELAHMWFGNLVTMDWWDEIWLNEGFASFFEYPAIDHVHPEWQIWDQFLSETLCKGMAADEGSRLTRSMVQNVEDTPVGVYDFQDQEITYKKSATIVRSFGSFLSDEVIQNGLRTYLNTHIYGSVDSDDLWTALSKADRDVGGTDVKRMMDSWTLQAGVPLVTVSRIGGDSVKIQQTQFFTIPEEPATKQLPDDRRWNIPLTYTYKSEHDFQSPLTTWLLTEEDTIKIRGLTRSDWIVFNVNQTGYYRVNYDNENWEKLAEALKRNFKVFPTQTRAALLNDAFTLALAGHIDIVYALQLTEYLHLETEYVVWEMVLKHLPKMYSHFFRLPDFALFEKYWRNKTTPLYNSLGWDLSTSDLLEYRKRLQSIKVSCAYGNNHCLQTSHQLFRMEMDNPQNVTLVNIDGLVKTVYCAAIRKGDIDDWMSFHCKNNDDDDFEATSPICCTREAWLLQWYLEKHHRQNKTYIGMMKMLDKSKVGFSTAWEFFLERFDELLEKEEDAYDYLSNFAPFLNTEEDLQQVMEFGSRYNDMPTSAAASFYRSLDIVKRNRSWLDKNRDSVARWLEDVTRDLPSHVPYEGRDVDLSKIVSASRIQPDLE